MQPDGGPLEESGRDADASSLHILDLVRGGAAIYVAAYHCVDLLAGSGRRFHNQGGSLRMLSEGNILGLFGFGYYAVLLFFVLSGFVIHLRQAARPEMVGADPRRWLRTYCWKRSVRIYPPLIATLALTAVLGALGAGWFPDLYGSRLDHPTAANLVDSAGTAGEAVEILIPAHGGATFGANGALWSIGYELWFYAAYIPIALVVLRRTRQRLAAVLGWSLVLATAAAALQAQFPGSVPARLQPLAQILVYFPAWVLGACLAEAYVRRWRPLPPHLMVTAGAMCLGVAASVATNRPDPGADLIWCAGFALLIGAAVLGPPLSPATSKRIAFAGRLIAPWSYSLYLVHMPVLVFTFGMLADGTGPTGNPLVVAGCFGATISVSLVMWLTVERPTTILAARPPRPAPQTNRRMIRQ